MQDVVNAVFHIRIYLRIRIQDANRMRIRIQAFLKPSFEDCKYGYFAFFLFYSIEGDYMPLSSKTKHEIHKMCVKMEEFGSATRIRIWIQ